MCVHCKLLLHTDMKKKDRSDANVVGCAIIKTLLPSTPLRPRPILKLRKLRKMHILHILR